MLFSGITGRTEQKETGFISFHKSRLVFKRKHIRSFCVGEEYTEVDRRSN